MGVAEIFDAVLDFFLLTDVEGDDADGAFWMLHDVLIDDIGDLLSLDWVKSGATVIRSFGVDEIHTEARNGFLGGREGDKRIIIEMMVAESD